MIPYCAVKESIEPDQSFKERGVLDVGVDAATQTLDVVMNMGQKVCYTPTKVTSSLGTVPLLPGIVSSTSNSILVNADSSTANQEEDCSSPSSHKGKGKGKGINNDSLEVDDDPYEDQPSPSPSTASPQGPLKKRPWKGEDERSTKKLTRKEEVQVLLNIFGGEMSERKAQLAYRAYIAGIEHGQNQVTDAEVTLKATMEGMRGVAFDRVSSTSSRMKAFLKKKEISLSEIPLPKKFLEEMDDGNADGTLSFKGDIEYFCSVNPLPM